MTYTEQAIEILDCDSQKVLCLIAFKGEGTTLRILKDMTRQNNISAQKLKEILRITRERGMCSERYIKDVFHISPIFFLPIIRHLVIKHPRWIDEFKTYGLNDLRTTTSLSVLRDSAIDVLQGKQIQGGAVDLKYTLCNTIGYLLPAAQYPDLYPLLEMLSASHMDIFIDKVTDMLFDTDIPDEYDSILQMVEELSNIKAPQKAKAKEIVALYKYYAYGEYRPVSGQTLYGCILRGVRALHNKDFDAAEYYLNKALRLRNQQSDIKNVFLNMMTCYFLIAYYINDPSEKNEKKLQQFVNKKEVREQISLMPAYLVAAWHTDLGHQVNAEALRQMHRASEANNMRALKAMANYLSAAFKQDIPGNSWNKYMPQHAILQHEFQNFLDIDKDRLKELNELFGSPILFEKKPLEPWEIVLNDVTQNITSGSITEKKREEKQERLAYVIRGKYVEVREQTRTKTGGWSAGKGVSSSRYREGNLGMMDETDIEIWKRNRESSYAIRIEDVLPYLVGSDKVLMGCNAPLLPVTVEEEQPCLLIERSKKGFHISSNIPYFDERNEYINELSSIHYVVIRIDRSKKMLFKQLLELKELPLEAEDKLKEVLPIISSQIQIKSPQFEFDKLETINSESLIVLQVKPAKGSIFHVHLYAKANLDMKGLYEPGNGMDTLFDNDQNGNLKRVKRNLDKERYHLMDINRFIGSLNSSSELVSKKESDAETTFLTLGLEEMLDTLEYINKYADRYVLEWAEGAKLRTRSLSKKNWKISLHKASNWFKMEGYVKLDDDVPIKIGRLLELASHSQQQNYVQLNDTDFIKLTDSMRKQLALLEALSIKEKNEYRIPLTNALLLNETLDEALPIEKGEDVKEAIEKIQKSYTLEPKLPRNLQGTLRDYQLEGFKWMTRLSSWGAGACLADDMGLGKTVQTITMLLSKAKGGASLVVAPTSVISNWKHEIERFAPSLHTMTLNELHSEERAEVVKKASANDVVLATYGLMHSETEVLQKKKWNVICLDEAHSIKNRETKTAQTIYTLKSKARIALTGTPLQNHLGELWSLFNFINPGMLGGYDTFRQRFVLPIENGDKERQQMLRRVVLPFILRRTKKEVIKELPEKTEIQYDIELSPEEMHTYEFIRKKAQQQLEEEQKVSISVLAEITKLRQAACASGLAVAGMDNPSSKLEQMMQLVNEIIQEDNRVLIFSQFTSFLKMAKERLDKENIDYLYLDGATTMKQREEMVKRFQNGESNIFIISLKAGGLGLNLTEANYVIHMDPWWNPAIEQQATDRAYRIGQEQKVTVYHLISTHTIEEKILRLHQTKRDLSDSLLEGANVSHKLTEEDLKELLSD